MQIKLLSFLVLFGLVGAFSKYVHLQDVNPNCLKANYSCPQDIDLIGNGFNAMKTLPSGNKLININDVDQVARVGRYGTVNIPTNSTLMYINSDQLFQKKLTMRKDVQVIIGANFGYVRLPLTSEYSNAYNAQSFFTNLQFEVFTVRIDVNKYNVTVQTPDAYVITGLTYGVARKISFKSASCKTAFDFNIKGPVLSLVNGGIDLSAVGQFIQNYSEAIAVAELRDTYGPPCNRSCSWDEMTSNLTSTNLAIIDFDLTPTYQLVTDPSLKAYYLDLYNNITDGDSTLLQCSSSKRIFTSIFQALVFIITTCVICGFL